MALHVSFSCVARQAWNDILANMRAAFPQEDLVTLRMNTVDDLKNQVSGQTILTVSASIETAIDSIWPKWHVINYAL